MDFLANYYINRNSLSQDYVPEMYCHANFKLSGADPSLIYFISIVDNTNKIWVSIYQASLKTGSIIAPYTSSTSFESPD